MTLSAFIMNEGLKQQQVRGLHRFNELYRAHVLIDLRERLAKAWTGELITSTAKLSKAEEAEARLINPDALTKAILSLSSINSHYGNKPVSPSVAIPLTLSVEKRSLLENRLLDVSQLVLEQLIAYWTEAFSYERGSGKLATYFKIKRDTTSVRLVITSQENSTSLHEAVICYIAIERGKPNTKRKAYDLIALCTPGKDL